jgi:hypothetical protein
VEVSNLKRTIIVLGYLMILTAVMIAFTRTLIIDIHSGFETGSVQISRNAQSIEYTLWDTRTHRVMIDVSPATSRIDFYLLDEKGIETLRQEGNLEPVISLQDVDGCDFTYEPPYRGAYGLVIQNRSNQTTNISERVISQGLEWDILQFSALLAIIGVILALVPRLIPTRRPPIA